jgi:hypothetical protein
VLASVHDRCTVFAKHTIGLEIVLYAPADWVMRLKWKVVSVRLETVLVSMQYRCTVCAKRTKGSEIVLDTPDVIHLGDKAQMEAHYNSFRDSANLDSR